MATVVHRVEVSARGMKELAPELDRLLDAGWTHVDCASPRVEMLKPDVQVVAAFVKELR
ncbi:MULTISPECIES: hypothetical protein [Mycolicibacterium]|uniref:hypothetical protein n=1 Tax=Mycolicibacterium TaxID=1866885 RepID=UPI000AD9CABF|nr:hypothetical protein [Mycolicibacterium fortuitum]